MQVEYENRKDFTPVLVRCAWCGKRRLLSEESDEIPGGAVECRELRTKAQASRQSKPMVKCEDPEPDFLTPPNPRDEKMDVYLEKHKLFLLAFRHYLKHWKKETSIPQVKDKALQDLIKKHYLEFACSKLWCTNGSLTKKTSDLVHPDEDQAFMEQWYPKWLRKQKPEQI